ncbi:hypothetical protein MPER_10935 [Moniliophthora perniciosa FA553]|nr:hypothetical protein MPER_10935 [Moniliophthora perniciosa FA553]
MKTLMLWGTAAITNLFAAANFTAAAPADYFQPNSTGVKLQNGYERVLIQERSNILRVALQVLTHIYKPFGNHAFRVRASIMRDPTGNECFTIRNGDLIAGIQNGTISFHRVEGNGSMTLLTGEYVDTKTLLPRYYFQDFRSSSFEAWFSFSSEEDEQFYGVGQQSCCNDHSVNKKGQVVDLMKYNSHVTMPVYKSKKVGK